MSIHMVVQEKALVKKNKELKNELMKRKSKVSQLERQIAKLNSEKTMLRGKLLESEKKNKLFKEENLRMQKALRGFDRLYGELENELKGSEKK